MTKKTAALVIILIFLLINGLIFNFRRNIQEFFTPTTTPDFSRIAAIEIDLTDKGFVPETVTIRVDTPVRFINKSKGPMWIASTPHPYHTDLPGFDQSASASAYFYTFTKVGIWKFHNHMNPKIVGQVVVTSH